jgi:hypothetical protein
LRPIISADCPAPVGIGPLQPSGSCAHRPNRSPVLPRRSITVGERSARSGPACVPRRWLNWPNTHRVHKAMLTHYVGALPPKQLRLPREALRIAVNAE